MDAIIPWHETRGAHLEKEAEGFEKPVCARMYLPWCFFKYVAAVDSHFLLRSYSLFDTITQTYPLIDPPIYLYLTTHTHTQCPLISGRPYSDPSFRELPLRWAALYFHVEVPCMSNEQLIEQYITGFPISTVMWNRRLDWKITSWRLYEAWKRHHHHHHHWFRNSSRLFQYWLLPWQVKGTAWVVFLNHDEQNEWWRVPES